jgi:hypothetical protein
MEALATESAAAGSVVEDWFRLRRRERVSDLRSGVALSGAGRRRLLTGSEQRRNDEEEGCGTGLWCRRRCAAMQ